VSNRQYLKTRLNLSAVKTSPSQLIWDLVQQLSPDQNASFHDLSHVELPANLPPEQVQLAIFQTNAVGAGSNVGLFPTMARLNHGCSGAFNSVYSWREREGVLVVHALKNINKGEELLTAYFGTRQTRDVRRYEFLRWRRNYVKVTSHK
jgi:SET domain